MAANFRAQGNASLISSNGFSCSTLEGQTLCQGKFEEVDKDLVFGAKGTGAITLQVKKGDELFTYSSLNGCLCQAGKKEKFKGDKMKEASSSFCALKK